MRTWCTALEPSNSMLHQPQGPPAPSPRIHLSNPALPEFVFTPTVLIQPLMYLNLLASSLGRKRLPGKKGTWRLGCLKNKFLKKKRDKLTTPTKLAREPTFWTKKQKLSQEFSLRNIPQRPKHYIHNTPCKLPTSFICARPFAWPWQASNYASVNPNWPPFSLWSNERFKFLWSQAPVV